ncbi:hypothetical protein DEG02_006830 [Xanthomonas vasicola]|nr:hypothetical protein KWO_015275 [Xanthomonas vasicola pv. musacearum NCPPB 4379]KFA08652.1 hypothetical protein KWM_0112975 [Xanthomonas vasicola pv. musacearum NCPPB 2005]KFA08783.1 hypothetical protein KWQ_0113890 [Xanthomonas vasicola pv. musacearum NCPPB 4380]KFA15411.1 hypothetical protein A11G_0121670 [Xanthomonas vasicola pv. musacearum NCPPB 4392]KFA17495.1 hypothetical protein KWU_0121260 [Xanthomonas vasicola pv. musacearum NCPPB 4394]KFA23106.1 hypothetical protein KWS_0121555 [X
MLLIDGAVRSVEGRLDQVSMRLQRQWRRLLSQVINVLSASGARDHLGLHARACALFKRLVSIWDFERVRRVVLGHVAGVREHAATADTHKGDTKAFLRDRQCWCLPSRS